MTGVRAEYINPFILASTQILNSMCGIKAIMGKPFLKNTEFEEDSVLIMIGITGQVRGQVIIAMNHDVACNVASKMMMMSVDYLDEIATSAISELGNMILGNTATVFSNNGVIIDITTPTIAKGRVCFSSFVSPNIAIPLIYDEDKSIQINVSLCEK